MWKRLKQSKGFRGWYVWKLKFVDARLYFISIFVGLTTGLVAVPYHYLLRYFFSIRQDFFQSHPKWYYYIAAFLVMWATLIFVAWLVKKLPYITGGGIPQTRAVINGRIKYTHPLLNMLAKFVGGILSMVSGLSLGREGPSIQFGSYVGWIFSKWGRVLAGEQKQLLAAGAGAGLSAAFAAPLSSSLLVIETIERFDASKTAITTLLAGVVAAGVSLWLLPIHPYSLVKVVVPGFGLLNFIIMFLIIALLISFIGKLYSIIETQFRRLYHNVKLPSTVKMLYLVIVAFIISIYNVNLTGGGEQFLIQQSMSDNTELKWLIVMTIIHLLFTLMCVSTELPGGSFIPTLVNGGLIGRIVGLYMVERGFIGYEHVNFIMLLCVTAFLVAIIRTPLTAIVLITEITGEIDLLFPSVLVGGVVYYLTELLQIKPINNQLYSEMIKNPLFKANDRTTLNVEVMTGSFFDGKLVDDLHLPIGCQLLNIHRDGKDFASVGMTIVPGDQLCIELDSDDIEKLYEPLTSMANIY